MAWPGSRWSTTLGLMGRVSGSITGFCAASAPRATAMAAMIATRSSIETNSKGIIPST